MNFDRLNTHVALQNMIFLIFFLYLWANFALPDLDPLT
jgi:hypothetical protein